MRYLSAMDLRDLASPATLIAAMEQALRDYAAHRVIVPARQHLDFGDNTLLTMPVVGEGTFGAKFVSVVPSNADRGLLVTNGLMMLSDRTTGVPLAVLNAAALTAQRTGAVGALGLKYTTPAEVDRIGVIGTGTQGIWQAIFACAVRQVSTVYVFARSEEKAQRFAEAVGRYVPSVCVLPCRDVRELLAQTEVVIAATTSSHPVLPDEKSLVENKHFISVGSFKPSMQELPNAVYELAQCVIVDSLAAKHEVGDLVAPLASGLLQEKNVLHLAELVTGRQRIDTAHTAVCKSVGMALYDLHAARTFLAKAQRLGRGTPLEA